MKSHCSLPLSHPSYEAPKAQVVRRFQNLGVQRANPTEYVARYGTQLEDSQALVSHARQVGVVEDLVSSLPLLVDINGTSLFCSSRHLALSERRISCHRATKTINPVD